jgi:dihydrofolate reductase
VARTQLYIAQSLDGYIADEAGGVEWLESRGAGGDFGYHDFLEAIGAIAMGAATYEQLVGWDIDWPYPEQPTWVFTHRELPVPEGSDVRFTDRPPAEVVSEIERETDGNIWLVGGGALARQWIDERVLDELILFVVPLLLGRGVRLFGDTRETELELTEVRSYPSGFVELRYRLPRDPA